MKPVRKSTFDNYNSDRKLGKSRNVNVKATEILRRLNDSSVSLYNNPYWELAKIDLEIPSVNLRCD